MKRKRGLTKILLACAKLVSSKEGLLSTSSLVTFWAVHKHFMSVFNLHGQLITNANQELRCIDYQCSTHFGVVNTAFNAYTELRTGLLLLMSFGHFVIPEGIKQ